MNDDVTFGHWLKRARHSLDLTQEALARQVGCATHTLQKIEQGSRRPSRQLADLLANALQIAPSQRVSFLQLARMPLTAKPEQYAPQQLAGVDSGPTTLERRMVLPTPATALIGRQTERADLMQQLANPACRILTLVGPGGVGKSRLALQLALELADQFSDGVAWVALESVSGLVQFLTAFAEAIGCHLHCG